MLNAFTDPEAGLCDTLRSRDDLFESHVLAPARSISWPDKDSDWGDVVAVALDNYIEFRMPLALFPELPAPTASGVPCRIPISDPKLTRWFT